MISVSDLSAGCGERGRQTEWKAREREAERERKREMADREGEGRGDSIIPCALKSLRASVFL